MIKSIKHKGLKAFFDKGSTKGIRADHADRLRDRLTVLDVATSLDDIATGNWGLHPLSGKLKGQHAINVSGNWRLFFEFHDGNIHLLDYDDYH
ncbi:type II toxin-antitoxin system RelE/ParE family toxin [Gilvimarinus sp. SDUM040013]|uniref:Type II toxin-antitoxin system RelE/ParE family toxin n=1 Tax=Gilvimarinus gilvus TaxID=3058038 RepID=A0ABU4S035_9GAMM|nr:type II toxin-antitoxin system RelE/ParE family toxin [Gilvimarinus sp. SDUM040013]MDO3386062.1 type II toxin-antitoxin system RelE/ParE family toxin [Gilvimarinus sp. SDUM040013]MDX6850515.1 type II toxin-antitoxin system RelE/ParE family toxin [Gilvimarinus sp. SDUM040013]